MYWLKISKWNHSFLYNCISKWIEIDMDLRCDNRVISKCLFGWFVVWEKEEYQTMEIMSEVIDFSVDKWFNKKKQVSEE